MILEEDKILNIIHNSGLYKLLLDYMVKSYKYECLKCTLENNCKITFEINTDDNKQFSID